MSLNRRILAGTAAVALTLGLAACSQDAKEAASSATDAAGNAAASATSAAGDAANSAKESAGDAASSAADAAKGGADKLTSIPTAQGDVEVPAAVATAAEENQLGEAVGVTKGNDEGQYIVEYSDGRYVVNTEDNGGVLIQGKIAETWLEQGGYDAEVGVPVSAEQRIDNGWTQEFTKGTINWTSETGQVADYKADVQTK
ncbi:hypothetical protein L1O03_06580 [Corynebacterium uropygiale]|uniref:LGFP repeat-containing protein n=1 Tax=Corynebacterium uropygiale TaxID=1775911 RepID=A0A9X1U0I9_9CORY|nr:hypothetical protein [Corynebacterium uropygiale]MCF4006844.1 hypothetical protein [Corynebacterium uropygiale]